MGLDMYLYRAEKNKYVHEETEYCECLKCRPKYLWVEEAEIGYWRKANAIHGWFVRNLADGVDECQQIEVSLTDLLRLQEECRKVLANKPDVLPTEEDEGITTITAEEDTPNEVVAKMLMDMLTLQHKEKEFNSPASEEDPLPPTGGFFFGSTSRDEWYYRDIEETLEILAIAISEIQFLDEDEALIYQASW